jgi:hypothetical protein
MARDLEQLKKVLWDQFEEAVKRHPDYDDRNQSGEHAPFNPKVQNRSAIANIAQAIVVLEREQREAHEQIHGRSMPGKS